MAEFNMGLIVKHHKKKPRRPHNIPYCMTPSTRQWKCVYPEEMFVSAPTRCGKSLTLELALKVFDFFNGENGCNSNAKFIVLVHVVLLISLMKDQVFDLNSCSISASYSTAQK